MSNVNLVHIIVFLYILYWFCPFGRRTASPHIRVQHRAFVSFSKNVHPALNARPARTQATTVMHRRPHKPCAPHASTNLLSSFFGSLLQPSLRHPSLRRVSMIAPRCRRRKGGGGRERITPSARRVRGNLGHGCVRSQSQPGQQRARRGFRCDGALPLHWKVEGPKDKIRVEAGSTYGIFRMPRRLPEERRNRFLNQLELVSG